MREQKEKESREERERERESEERERERDSGERKRAEREREGERERNIARQKARTNGNCPMERANLELAPFHACPRVHRSNKHVARVCWHDPKTTLQRTTYADELRLGEATKSKR